MDKLSLLNRLKSVNYSAKKGYLIGQWTWPDKNIYLASHENNQIGFTLDEIINALEKEQENKDVQ